MKSNQNQLSGLRLGIAGWSIPQAQSHAFPAVGTHLERYSQRFNAVEINSSFYRPHKPSTYARWAESTPRTFKFSVKAPREITHTRKLEGAEDTLKRFLTEIENLGSKLGPVLIQLPPSLRFDNDIAAAFFDNLRSLFAGQVVCEPRHQSWFTPFVDCFLEAYKIARVAADPARYPEAATPGGWRKLIYRRLHGSPRVYYSAYSREYLQELSRLLANESAICDDCWCIFDNTALGHAPDNAMVLMKLKTQLGIEES